MLTTMSHTLLTQGRYCNLLGVHFPNSDSLCAIAVRETVCKYMCCVCVCVCVCAWCVRVLVVCACGRLIVRR